ncbi:MAG: homocysteine S-methyltransferase family protein [Candidatus Omnitrophica bacterium]|nr:homocysteine S-methyltransferase family protein [Candidatus Omnitrophota bacterium]
MKELLERLKEEVLVCDGATGTMLIENGMPEGVCPEEWAIKNRLVLSKLHKAYVGAGADMITSNTFGANAIKLRRFNLQKQAVDINKRAVEIAKDAAGGKAYVLGDVGPTGEYLKPAGDLESDEMLEVFIEQIKALESAGVDAIIIETMSDAEELKRAIMAAKESTGLPLIASMTFQKTGEKGFRTTSGVTIPQFVDESLLAGCDVIGTNCSLTISDMVDVVSGMRNLGTAFLLAQPNAGMPKLVGERTVYEQSADEFKESVPALIKAGANIIGGCCGTTPEHTRAIKTTI